MQMLKMGEDVEIVKKGGDGELLKTDVLRSTHKKNNRCVHTLFSMTMIYDSYPLFELHQTSKLASNLIHGWQRVEGYNLNGADRPKPSTEACMEVSQSVEAIHEVLISNVSETTAQIPFGGKDHGDEKKFYWLAYYAEYMKY